ncbi:hypothetical protein GQ54DRAFT_300202, partial [Martensiomyces pterosporus]
TQESQKRRVMFYTPIGCTFDSEACHFLSGCSTTVKVCDKSSRFACDIRLPKDYTYLQLGDKSRDTIEYLCSKEGTKYRDSYDIFVKVDDDVLFFPPDIQDALDKVEVDGKAMLGYLRVWNDGTIWPQGSMYMFTRETLDELCKSEEARKQLNGRKEDVNFGKALSVLGNVTYYNLDHIAKIHHIQYRSSRVYVQYLQYGKCSM